MGGNQGGVALNEGAKKSYSPIFTKCFDFLNWLVPATNRFPKLHRHTITRRLLDAALDLQENLVVANNRRGRQRLLQLDTADTSLDKVRIYLRIAHRFKWINDGQYEHVSAMTAEIGRLLGGWKRATAP